MGSMGSSANDKRTTITNVSQQATSTALGGVSQLGQIFMGKKAQFKGNLSLVGPTTTSIERAGAVIPTISGSEGSSTGQATSATNGVVPHLFGLTWIQWALVGAVALGIYWFFKRKG